MPGTFIKHCTRMALLNALKWALLGLHFTNITSHISRLCGQAGNGLKLCFEPWQVGFWVQTLATLLYGLPLLWGADQLMKSYMYCTFHHLNGLAAEKTQLLSSRRYRTATAGGVDMQCRRPKDLKNKLLCTGHSSSAVSNPCCREQETLGFQEVPRQLVVELS